MKYVFTSLLCHRDVEIFKFNWFCMHAHLDKGFDIPHVIVSDGSLNEEEIAGLRQLPNVFVEEDPIEILIGSDGNPVPKAPLLGKLQCHKRCFDNYGADRAVLLDCDIFFFRNWEADLRKILTERAVVLRDWGSSLGTNGPQYRELFGVFEDATTPNCNTGVIGINKEDYHLIEEKIKLHQSNTFMMMEDQGAVFAAFYGDLSYVNGIKCVINGAENHEGLWPYFVKQNAIHLMGMRERPQGLKTSVALALAGLPDSISLSQFTPIDKHISFGLLEYGHYNFAAQFQKIPSSVNRVYINDALYLHGGSHVKWKLPPRCKTFMSQYVCMDTGIANNVRPVTINGQIFNLNDEINVPLSGDLHISTQEGPGTHLAFLFPTIEIDKTTQPDLSAQLKH
jgi:hypothetical protein